MKRIISLITPHLVFWGIITLILLSTFYRELPVVIDGIFLFIGMFIIVYAPKTGLWWQEMISEQRENMVEHFKIRHDTARKILYGWYIRVPEVWVFRILGITLALLATYHLYYQYANMANNQVLDNKSVTGIIVNILMIFYLFMWWSNARGTPYRKTILMMGLCWIVTAVTFVLAVLFDGGPVVFITVVAFFTFVYFYIKVWRAQRRYRAQDN